MNQNNFDIIELDNKFSTTRRVQKVDADLVMTELKAVHKPEDKFETVLFLPEGEGRQGEGGLRTQGYFKKSEVDKPLITVVTVVYNGEQFLEETILSVINQAYDNVEYIIIDGGSTDGTLDIIRKYKHAIDYWVSEKDHGISDAFNKAVRCSLGDYINFQGDGDGFCKEDGLLKLVKALGHDRPGLVSAKIKRIDVDGARLFISTQPGLFNKGSLLHRMSLPHQGLLTHKSFFKEFGLFDTNNVFCMDYELLLRAYNDFPKVKLVNIVLANWRDDGLGNGRIKDVLKEYHSIKLKNGVASPFFLKLIYYWTVIKYELKRALYNGS